MKKLLLLLSASVLFLAACGILPGPPNENGEEEQIEEASGEERTISREPISEGFYNVLFPYEVSSAREMITSNMIGRVDIDNFEMGMVRLAQSTFSTDDYVFQEGQHLPRETLVSWIRRQTEANPNGLNPTLPTEGTTEERHQQAPFYLAHIVEHNYLRETGDGQYELGGMVIGLAMNSVHYFNLDDAEGGFPREFNIPNNVILEQGQAMAGEILNRIRQMEGLEEIPVTFLIYRQEGRDSIIPGTFLSRTDVGRNSSTVGSWSGINEQNVLFPSSVADNDYAGDATTFNTFATRVRQYFPDVIGVIGRGAYRDNQLYVLDIDIPMIFRSESDIVGMTQYVAGLVAQHFPTYIEVNVYISSPSRNESLIVRVSGSNQPFLHIFQ